MNLEEKLFKYFGHKKFRSGQKEIITSILSGESVIAVLPTGAGKSICYQIPSLISESFSLIISPLIALMKDQVDALNKEGEVAAFINSTMTFQEAENVLLNIAYGKIKLLYVAPERLANIGFAERIKKLSPKFLFVDEAHCISEWGHNFRPSYSKINEFIEYVSINKVSAFTATATPEVVKDISKQLNLKNPKIVVRGFERENLRLNVLLTKKKREKCLELIKRHSSTAIIYTSSRKNAEEISQYLNMHKINCAYYHAGLAPEIRKKIQEDFIYDKVPVIAATNAFGMGIDKKDIRLIIHYNTTGSIENYYQEIGRAGRDGKQSYTYLLHEDYDINIQNFFLSNSHPDKDLIQNIYAAVCDHGKIAEGNIPDKEIPINYDFISAYCKRKVSSGMLHSALKILENAGYIKQLSEYDRKITVQFIIDKNRLKDFLQNTKSILLKEVIMLLLREYGGTAFTTKNYVSISSVSSQLNFEEFEIEEALITLDNLSIISYDKITAKENIILTAPRINADRLRLDYKKINEHYLHLQQKLSTMVDFVFTNECRFKFILNYFGEDVEGYTCGKCDRCVSEGHLPSATADYIKEIILRTLAESGEKIGETSLIRIISGSAKRDSSINFSTFAACSNYKKDELKGVIHQLISEGMINRTGSLTGKLALIKKGKDFLQNFNLIMDEDENTPHYEVSLERYHQLREIREKASKKFMQTPYLICSDEILRIIAQKNPSTKDELLAIPGFNSRMFNKIGLDILELIHEDNSGIFEEEKSVERPSTAPKDIPANIKETFILVQKGYSLKDIASLRKLTEAVISMQIETILEYNSEINISHLFNKDELMMILKEVKKGYKNLKELKERLPHGIGYPQIRIAIAKYRSNSGSFPAKLQHTE
jgi:ATP-dependent DNA helicase RecQ